MNISFGIWTGVVVIAMASAAWVVHDHDQVDASHVDASRSHVPGMRVTVTGIPAGWTMRPPHWVVTRLEGHGAVAATATWWPQSTVEGPHNTFEVCVERIKQHTCPTVGDSVVVTGPVGDDKRMSVSVLERSPNSAGTSDAQAWQKVKVK